LCLLHSPLRFPFSMVSCTDGFWRDLLPPLERRRRSQCLKKNSFGFTFVLPGRNVTVGVLDAVPVTGTIGSEQDAAPTLVRRFFSLS
jgi:hypothetical protein